MIILSLTKLHEKCEIMNQFAHAYTLNVAKFRTAPISKCVTLCMCACAATEAASAVEWMSTAEEAPTAITEAKSEYCKAWKAYEKYHGRFRMCLCVY